MTESTLWVPSREPRRPARLSTRVPATADDPRWEKLREPFPASQVGRKPQPWCSNCGKDARKHCDLHQLIRCQVCRQRVTEAHLDLDFVGHAAVTLRLLTVDPLWEWWPMPEEERKERGFPAVDDKGMWIWLDVLGHVRPGLGETEGGRLVGANAVKARMSDAIKNAAMRFGVAIETWSKEDLADNAAAAAEAANTTATGTPDAPPDPNAPPARDWAREIGTAPDEATFQKVTEECKRAGALEGAALIAARARKKSLDKATRPVENPPNPGGTSE